jgi:hypothetical protein
VAGSSETLVPLYQTTQHHTGEDRKFQSGHQMNLDTGSNKIEHYGVILTNSKGEMFSGLFFKA